MKKISYHAYIKVKCILEDARHKTIPRLDIWKPLRCQLIIQHLDHSTLPKRWKNSESPVRTWNLQPPTVGSGGHLGYDTLQIESSWELTKDGRNVLSCCGNWLITMCMLHVPCHMICVRCHMIYVCCQRLYVPCYTYFVWTIHSPI